MKKFKSISLIGLISVVLDFAVPAIAQFPPTVPPVVAFNSFGPGNSYSTAIVWGVSGASTGGGYRGQAEFFTPSVSGYLSSFTLATDHVSGSNLSNFSIAQDNGSGAPGSILESFNNISNPNGLLTLKSVVDPLLQAGTQYWICDEPGTTTSYNGWYYNNQGQANGFAFERSQGSWSYVAPPCPASGVFQVSVVPVPEPSALAFVLTGAFLLAGKIRRAGK
jgi:hypothetical protein